MVKTLEAVLDGSVRLAEPFRDLEPNTRVRITVEDLPEKGSPARSFLETARSLNLDGPADWSEKVDDYLYGRSHDTDG